MIIKNGSKIRRSIVSLSLGFLKKKIPLTLCSYQEKSRDSCIMQIGQGSNDKEKQLPRKKFSNPKNPTKTKCEHRSPQ
jgi:hypothetical protein